MIEIKHVNFQYKGVEQAGLHEIGAFLTGNACCSVAVRAAAKPR